jgi:plasmid maintenance system antidote protein VapI
MKSFSVGQLTDVLRKMCAESSQAQVARHLGVFRSSINHILSGRKPLGPRIADRMGFGKAPDRYVRKSDAS